MINKICGHCKNEKNINEFGKNLSKKDKLNTKCKECMRQQYKKYYYSMSIEQKNKQKMRGRIINMTSIQVEKSRSRKRKENLTPKQIEKNRIRSKIFNLNVSKEKRKLNNLKRVVSNMTLEQIDKKRKSQNKRERLQRKINPIFSLRETISRNVNKILQCKNGESILKYLPYTIQELKKHLEFLFEPWMNWNNRGKYHFKLWNDDDESTWVWNIDHIIPQSDLPYSSMEDENFKICWSLSNLRPLSAKQNLLDGVSRSRHSIKNETPNDI